jgi:monoamine oxidase
VERMSDVVVIGAGVAGLAAAGELAHAGLRVTLVEARQRMGGRIHTLDPEGAGGPVELGAEFIHGRPPELLGCLADAKTPLAEVTGETACFADGVLFKCPENGAFQLLNELPAVVERDGDMSFAEFLRRRKADPAEAAQARAYVEGFNAADAERIGIAALARQHQAEGEIDGDRAFRAADGYDVLPLFLAQRAEQGGVRIVLRAPVTAIEWRAGRVVVRTDATEAPTIRAQRALITLPLGVLQARTVAFVPEPVPILQAADTMAPGAAQRLSLVFRSRFWEAKMPGMGFLFTREITPRTWWTQQPRSTPVLTAWFGGPKATAIADLEPGQLVAQSLRSLEQIFALATSALDDELRSWHMHNWMRDPYTRGAYSYAPVGAVDSSAAMAEPVEGTLYFAGEHTDTTGHWGTVHGALRSGVRAARQILAERDRHSQEGR